MARTDPTAESARLRVIREMKSKDILPIVRLVTRIVHRHLPAASCRVLLFGSWAALEATPTSDIDIAILGAEPVDAVVMAEIKEEIDRLPTLRKVDVVDLRRVDDRFREAVLRQGELVAS